MEQPNLETRWIVLGAEGGRLVVIRAQAWPQRPPYAASVKRLSHLDCRAFSR